MNISITRSYIRLAVILSMTGSMVLSCAGLPRLPEKPEVIAAQLVFKRLSLREATVVLTLELMNPNDFALRAGVIEYQLEIGGQKVLSGETEGNFELKPQGLSTIPLTLEIPYQSIGLAAGSLLSGGQLDYAVSGAVGLKGLLSGIKIPISQSGTLRRP